MPRSVIHGIPYRICLDCRRCSEETLHSVYDQIKAMLIKYHARISTLMPKVTGTQKGRVKKRKTKYIIVTQQPIVLDD